jgi:ATP-dependent Clp protease protease subunit
MIQANQGKGQKIQVKTKTDDDQADVYIYDFIDPYFGVSAAVFADLLAKITAATVNIHINSPGGDVFEGRAIAAAIRGYRGKTVARIEGLAASAASYIALAANEVEISDGSFFMIHEASALAWGTKADLRKTADLLDKIDAELVREYVAETGGDESTIRAWLEAETWFTADEAVEHGFADRKIAEFGASNCWNLSGFEKVPEALIKAPSPRNDDGSGHAAARRGADLVKRGISPGRRAA